MGGTHTRTGTLSVPRGGLSPTFLIPVPGVFLRSVPRCVFQGFGAHRLPDSVSFCRECRPTRAAVSWRMTDPSVRSFVRAHRGGIVRCLIPPASFGFPPREMREEDPSAHGSCRSRGTSRKGGGQAAQRRQPPKGGFQAHSCDGQRLPRPCGNSEKWEEHTLSRMGRSYFTGQGETAFSMECLAPASKQVFRRRDADRAA